MVVHALEQPIDRVLDTLEHKLHIFQNHSIPFPTTVTVTHKVTKTSPKVTHHSITISSVHLEATQS